MMQAISKFPLRVLLFVPVATYAASYCYLASYHAKWWLWNTIVHEGGTHTLLWTTLYASHFLGHIPSLTVIALIFTGFGLGLIRIRDQIGSNWKLLVGIIGLLIFSVITSGTKFGWRETVEFVLQQRQSVERMESGGSWLLHLPSTALMFVFAPLYIAIAARMVGRRVELVQAGRFLLLLGGVLVILITILAAGYPFRAFAYAFTDPRYLAHAVRELATFPLTFFPIPLYFFLLHSDDRERMRRDAKVLLIICAVILTVVFAYMVIIPLQQGISELAQNPTFARGGGLSILYLIASHYFEHFLDTIYFILLCALLVNRSRARGYDAGDIVNT
jgi:hypothetical protein